MALKPLHERKTDYFRFAILCTWGDEDNVPPTPEQGQALVAKTVNANRAPFFDEIVRLRKKLRFWRTTALVYGGFYLLHILIDMSVVLK